MSAFEARGRRLILSLAASAVALSLSVGTVLAETELGHTRRTGPHQLNDNAVNPVVDCNYDEDSNRLVSFDVRTPSIWARDRTSGRDRDRVGWQVIIKRWKDGAASWKTLHKSAIRKAPAWDDQSAFFESRHFAPTIPDDAAAFSRYYVLTRMFWYRQDGTVAGIALHRYDFYTERRGADEEVIPYCGTLYLE